MATMVRHDETTTRPEWPAHATRTDGEIDLRDDRDQRVERDDRVVRVADHDERRPSRGWKLLRGFGLIVAAALLCCIAVIAGTNNSNEVPIDAVFDTFRVPLWAVIGLAGVFGFVAGRLLDDRS